MRVPTLVAMAMLCAGSVRAAHAQVSGAGEAAEAVTAESVALRGYCPVAYLAQGKAAVGSKEFRVEHLGQVYYCASDANRQAFLADPNKYLPQFGGLCTMALGGPYGKRIESDPTVFEVVDGKVYLFSSERAKRYYDKNDPAGVRKKAEELWNAPGLKGYCPVSYWSAEGPVKGDARYKSAYGDAVYHLSSEAAKKQFDAEPTKYLPEYRGFCAVGVSTNRRHPGDAEAYRLHEGRLFLFFDQQTRSKFDADPASIVAAADEKWQTLKDLK